MNLDYSLIGKEFVHFKGGRYRLGEKPNYSGARFRLVEVDESVNMRRSADRVDTYYRLNK